MGVMMLIAVILVLTFTNNFLFITATQLDISTTAARLNRSLKEFQEKSRLMQDSTTELFKISSQKLSQNDSNKFSSLQSNVNVENSSHNGNSKSYHSLTTNPPTFVTRGRYIKHPFYYNIEDREMEFDDAQDTESLLNSGVPRWNRYAVNHKLNRYESTPIDTDITVDETDSNDYGGAFDFTGGGGGGLTSYDMGNHYRNPGNPGWTSGDATGWFSNPKSHPMHHPVPVVTEFRRPNSNQKMSINLTKIGLIALLKIAVTKMKALGFIKAILLVLFKLKLLLLMVAVKFLMLTKFIKIAMFLPALFSLFTVPMFLSRLFRLFSLLNQPTLVPNNNNSNQSTGTDSSTSSTLRRSDLNHSLDVSDDPGTIYFRQVLQSVKCVERISCRIAGAEQPSLSLIWLNWAATPISKYIPSKKIRTFISTFTDVTNYRLDNLYSGLLPNDWIKWCDDHYACNEN